VGAVFSHGKFVVYCGLEAVFDGSLGFTSVVLSLFVLLLSLCISHLLRWMDRLNIVKHTQFER
jgi:hypothetical protein